MKQFVSAILILSMLGQAFIRTALTVHYQYNRAYYLSHCENLYKPKLDCNGKCYLKKQMQVDASSDSEQPKMPEQLRVLKDLQLFFDAGNSLKLKPAATIKPVTLPPYVFHVSDNPATPLLMPPEEGCPA